MSDALEPNRIWHDPVVEIYGSLITPGVRCSGQAYDLANRRWYQLDVDSVVTDDDWMSSIVAKHIREYYQVNKVPPPWNTIQTTATGEPTEFKSLPYSRVERPIREKFFYGDQASDKFPTISSDELRDKVYLSRAADFCLWNGKKCVFKRIEFDVDVKSFTREIRTRETLLHFMTEDTSLKAAESEMMRRFHVIPILAVVTDCSGPGTSGNIFGFLMPFLGKSLEMVLERNEGSTVDLNKT